MVINEFYSSTNISNIVYCNAMTEIYHSGPILQLLKGTEMNVLKAGDSNGIIDIGKSNRP